MTNPYEAFIPLKHRTGIEPERTFWEWENKRVHIARRRREAPVRVIVVHGLGTHSGALWPLVAAIEGADLAAIDLPKTPLYDDWLRLLEAFISSEDDGRPLILNRCRHRRLALRRSCTPHRTGRTRHCHLPAQPLRPADAPGTVQVFTADSFDPRPLAQPRNSRDQSVELQQNQPQPSPEQIVRGR